MKTHSHSHYIVGRNARDLKVVTAKSSSGMTCPTRAGGTKKQMQEVLREAVRNWTHLTVGKEIEETAARLIVPEIELTPDELVDKTAAPRKPRRRDEREITVVIGEAAAPSSESNLSPQPQ